jgi:hypothetical protein
MASLSMFASCAMPIVSKKLLPSWVFERGNYEIADQMNAITVARAAWVHG